MTAEVRPPCPWCGLSADPDLTAVHAALAALVHEAAEEFAAAHGRWLAAFEKAPEGSEEQRIAAAKMDVWDEVVARLRERAARLAGAEERK